MKTNDANLSSSFRDPSGFLFFRNGSLYRQINQDYKENYDHLVSSGLYENLVNDGLLISHQEVELDYARTDKAYKVIKPEQIPFISYPYEWCFSQLKDAALTTLKIHLKALEFDMILKDGSAYNIQFLKGKPVLIDTLSFDKYREGETWVAYRQFCQHFLIPLALMSYKDIRLNQLLRIYIDGIPLDLGSSLLQSRTRLKLSLLSHIHLQAKSQAHFADKTEINIKGRKMSRLAFRALAESLESAIKKLKWHPKGTEWGDYYDDTNYSTDAFQEKKQLITEFLDKIKPEVVWDLGANTGFFSHIASDQGIQTISFDIDPAAVEKNYLECAKKKETDILPLVLDLANPSPGIGWENEERMSFLERGPTDTVFALALIHHLAISNNLPLDRIAHFFSKVCRSLIIEFVPKTDSQVKRLLVVREDVFPDYTQKSFEKSFENYFSIQSSVKIKNTERTLYMMKKK